MERHHVGTVNWLLLDVQAAPGSVCGGERHEQGRVEGGAWRGWQATGGAGRWTHRSDQHRWSRWVFCMAAGPHERAGSCVHLECAVPAAVLQVRPHEVEAIVEGRGPQFGGACLAITASGCSETSQITHAQTHVPLAVR